MSRGSERIAPADRIPAVRLGLANEHLINSPLPETLDIVAAIQGAALDRECLAYLRANRVQRIPRRLIGQKLGWEDARVECVRKRLQKRLKAFRGHGYRWNDFVIRRGNSRTLFYKEHLDSGHTVYALPELAEGFLGIMVAERAELFSEIEREKEKFISQAA